jgi:hypothetical protein
MMLLKDIYDSISNNEANLGSVVRGYSHFQRASQDLVRVADAHRRAVISLLGSTPVQRLWNVVPICCPKLSERLSLDMCDKDGW